MRSAPFLSVALALATVGCAESARNDLAASEGAANAAAPDHTAMPADGRSASASRDQVLRSETVTGTFTGWEMGDYLWAQIQVAGREPISAQPGPSPIDLFLDANRGRTVIVDIATVRTNVPEAGGMMEIERITGARTAETDADAWWQALSAADRQAAQRRFETGALSGR